MKIFTCSECGQMVFFHNVSCVKCGHALAYLPDRGVMSALEPVVAAEPVKEQAEPAKTSQPTESAPAPALFVALAPDAGKERYRLCENYSKHDVCNWAVPEGDASALCRSCRLNRVIPNLGQPEARATWERLEREKRRLLYTLDALRLPVDGKQSPDGPGLAFSFMADAPDGKTKVYTGHANGLITINTAEADDPYRERTKKDMGETYRTVLGHFRHESGHYYWDRLIRDAGEKRLERFRALFGDERKDYAAEQKRHYDEGPPADWPRSFVSAYASMHPWEDWAETWAHYLHMIDTLDTARSFGLVVRPKPEGGAAEPPVATRAVHLEDFDSVMSAWIPLTVALNSMNRSMGLPDLYPFVLSDAAVEKLRFVHEIIEAAHTSEVERAPPPAPARARAEAPPAA